MILNKKVEKTVVEEVNPYDWPENYYMETDPEKRKELLDGQNDPEEAEINKLREELWHLRYQKLRNGNVKDCFIAGWMDLILMKEQTKGKFGKGRLKKAALKDLELLGLNQVEHFGRDLLLAELKHAALLYCCSSAMDKQYGSIIFGFGKMKSEKINLKIMDDLKAVGWDIPKDLDIVQETALLTEAIELTKEHMGYN